MVLADNARFHHAVLHADWRDDCAERFSLLFLPPYSPELNPIERVWKLTRRLATHNRYFAHVDEVAHAVESIFEKWLLANKTLSKLCAII
jgi:transposase